jgi:hypothetical protein
VHWCEAVLGLTVGSCLVLQKKADHVSVSFLAGKVEWRESILKISLR